MMPGCWLGGRWEPSGSGRRCGFWWDFWCLQRQGETVDREGSEIARADRVAVVGGAAGFERGPNLEPVGAPVPIPLLGPLWLGRPQQPVQFGKSRLSRLLPTRA